jgi:hypothetical protein
MMQAGFKIGAVNKCMRRYPSVEIHGAIENVVARAAPENDSPPFKNPGCLGEKHSDLFPP